MSDLRFIKDAVSSVAMVSVRRAGVFLEQLDCTKFQALAAVVLKIQDF
jgi:hypothetical protein